MLHRQKKWWDFHRQHFFMYIPFITVLCMVLSSCGTSSGNRNGLTPSPVSTLTTPAASGEGIVLYTLRKTSIDSSGRQIQTDTIIALRASDGSDLWNVQMNGQINGDPSLDTMLVKQGMIFVTVVSPLGNSSLYALQASNGRVLWHYQMIDSGIQRLTVVDGTVYITTMNTSSLLALRATDGKLLWKHTPQNNIAGVVVNNGEVYITTATLSSDSAPKGALYALQASNGSLRWHAQLADGFFFEPMLLNGVIYVVVSNDLKANNPTPPKIPSDTLYAVQASDGKVLWHSQTWTKQVTPLLQGSDGVVYIVTTVFSQTTNPFPYVSAVEAFRAKDGTPLWHHQLSALRSGLIKVGGMLYTFDLYGGYIDALQASDGTILWSHHERVSNQQPQIFADDERVYLVNSASIEVLKASDGGVVWSKTYQNGNILFRLANGIVYVTTGADPQNSSVCAQQANTGIQLWCRQVSDVVELLAVGTA